MTTIPEGWRLLLTPTESITKADRYYARNSGWGPSHEIGSWDPPLARRLGQLGSAVHTDSGHGLVFIRKGIATIIPTGWRRLEPAETITKDDKYYCPGVGWSTSTDIGTWAPPMSGRIGQRADAATTTNNGTTMVWIRRRDQVFITDGWCRGHIRPKLTTRAHLRERLQTLRGLLADLDLS